MKLAVLVYLRQDYSRCCADLFSENTAGAAGKSHF